MNLSHHHTTDARRVSRIARSATLAVIALGFTAACTSSPTESSAGAKATPTAADTPATSSPPPTPSPATSSTATATSTPAPKPDPAPLGWPRPGWTAQTLGFYGISVSIPDTWYFDNNEVGTWTDGTINIFCDAWRDPDLLNPEGPNVIDLANSRWNATFGHGAAANAYGFQTFYGGNVWGADVTLGDGTTVEPRAFIVKDNVWIHCGAITRGTTSTAPELHDIIDSIQVVNPAAMHLKSWMENP
ncbi:hypothetical protein [Demequina lutea]|uniref:Uncharacterized protein n=1 Tax=Demequina lutea TaxID=431489 RepID=A0A7Y9ZC61_9MICO|nr:hypothetical protein [Demequina lutea]NYI42426.1 hypothetical protein [Demequina lutea]